MQREVAFSVVMVGLNNSGKTTMVKSMMNSLDEVFPTAGFAIDFVTLPKLQKPVLVYDCSGEGMHRKHWKTFYSQIDAVMFVIDAGDLNRFKYAKQQLHQLLKDYVVAERKLPICILLNKCDQKMLPKQTYAQALQLQKLQADYPNKFYMKETSGYTKQGLDQCFQWLQQLFL